MERRLKHKRSVSDPLWRNNDRRYGVLRAPGADDPTAPKQNRFIIESNQCALKREIVELRRRLENQSLLRCEMEKALIGARRFCYDSVEDKPIPKPAKELIMEIAMLELEVAYLEQQLLYLYRAVLDQRELPQSITDDEMHELSFQGNNTLSQELSRPEGLQEQHRSVLNSVTFKLHEKLSGPIGCRRKGNEEGHLLTPTNERCQSSLAEHFLASTPQRSATSRGDSSISLPLFTAEQPLMKSPNRLSEEMIKSISHIYCELADSPYNLSDYTATPFIMSLLQKEVLSHGQNDVPRYPYENFDSFISSLESSFHITDSQHMSTPYHSMRMVQGISKSPQKMNKIQHDLQAFRSLAYNLELVNPGNLNPEEKLAFWINIHNSLVMHAFLVNGIPRSSSKRFSIALKAAYNIGGQYINVETIQTSILHCQLLRPRQWLWPMLSPKIKSKATDLTRFYAIDHQEPRLHFALSLGNYSDPAVRIYTPGRLLEELETAKNEYIQSHVVFHKESKIFLPRIVDCFAKDEDLSIPVLLDTAENLLPESLRWSIRQFRAGKLRKVIQWIPHNFSFRYRFSKQLA